MVIALTIVCTPSVARVVRSSALVTKGRLYVEAAKVQGASSGRILWKLILPNVISPLTVQASFIFAQAIISEASLSFLGAMAQLCHSVRVMYLGTLVEEAETEELFANTLHPYTQALFASIPDFNRKERKVSLSGELPQYTDEFKGCVFHTRCPTPATSAGNARPKWWKCPPVRRWPAIGSKPIRNPDSHLQKIQTGIEERSNFIMSRPAAYAAGRLFT